MAAPLSPLTDEHFRAFGAIIHLFARHEALMVGVMSTLTKTELYAIGLLTAELPYRGKRETMLAMLKDYRVDGTIRERISWFMGELHKHNQLRNHIAHSRWTAGNRPKSIKPISLSIRGGTATMLGVNSEEKDYTDKEMINIAHELIRNRNQFATYLISNGLLQQPTSEDERK